jgi:hypothetical protein
VTPGLSTFHISLFTNMTDEIDETDQMNEINEIEESGIAISQA